MYFAAVSYHTLYAYQINVKLIPSSIQFDHCNSNCNSNSTSSVSHVSITAIDIHQQFYILFEN